MIDEITHEIEVGQVYEDARTGEKIELIYIDGNIYVLQNEGRQSHRLGSYSELLDNIESGRYKYLNEADSFAVTGSAGETETIPFEELDSIGEKGASNLRKAGYETTADIAQATDDELTDVSWVGEKGVTSIREWCEN
jgi:hypothetical protein